MQIKKIKKTVDAEINPQIALIDIKSCFTFREIGELEIDYPLLQIASFLRTNNIRVKILFNTFRHIDAENIFIDFIDEIEKSPPKIIYFPILEGYFPAVKKFIRLLKKKTPGIHIVLGGYYPTFAYKNLIKKFPWINFIVRGEEELTLFELTNALSENKKNLAKIAGLVFFKKNKLIITPDRENIHNLDSLPPLAEDHLEYAQKNNLKIERAYINTSRGCTHCCSFCPVWTFYALSPGNHHWRCKSAKAVVGEIETIYKKYGIKKFTFLDDNFLGKKGEGEKRAEKIAKEIIKRKLKIKFQMMSRADRIEVKTIRALKKAGLELVSLGIESGLQRALETFNKKSVFEKNLGAIRILNQLDIEINLFTIFFDPYLTLEEARESLHFLKNLQREFRSIIFPLGLFLNRMIPFMGTKIFERLKNENLLTGNFIEGYFYRFKDRRVSVLYKLSQKICGFLTLADNEIARFTFNYSYKLLGIKNIKYKKIFSSALFSLWGKKKKAGIALAFDLVEDLLAILENKHYDEKRLDAWRQKTDLIYNFQLSELRQELSNFSKKLDCVKGGINAG